MHLSRALVAVCLLLAGCGGTELARIKPEPPGVPALGMPLDEAVAQVFAVGFAGTGPDAPMVAKLRTRPWGVVVLQSRNATAALQARVLARSLLTAAHRGGHRAPLLTAAHPENYPGVNLLPQYQQISAAEARDQAGRAAEVLRAGSVRATFAPNADIAYASGPAADVAFSDSAARVSRLTNAAIEGWASGGVASIVGHFPGEGAASGAPEEGVATVGLSIQELRRRDLIPFVVGARDAPGIQLSDALYAAFDGVTPASTLPEAYRLLRRTQYDGVAVSGDLVAATAATGTSVGRTAVDALRAGADLLYVPGDAANQDEAYRAVLAAVRSGRVSRQRIAEALLRVSALKRDALKN